MTTIIKDGTGKGYSAQVTENNKLATSAVTRSNISDSSELSGSAFVMYGKHTMVGAGDENVIHITNAASGEIQIHIDEITFSTDGYQAKFEVLFDSVHSSGGRTLTALSLNRSSSKISNVTGLDGENNDLVCVHDDSKEFMDIRFGTPLGQTFTKDFKDALILGPGDTLAIRAEAPTGTKTRVSITFYEDSGAHT